MEFYIFILVVLFGTALSDLMVGVSNDAVNFLNSSIGSKAATRRTIMIIAALGVLVGTTFSSGMMEVARKGIFNPELFTMHEVMIIFLAVMLTDILLLDLYNTFGLPTSTTVSIVFEIFGGAVAISLIKIAGNGGEGSVLSYINTENVIKIISGIGLSVVFAFIFGSVIQFLIRLLYTFDYEKTFKRYGSIYCGLALTAITFFILVKGAKGSSIITDDMKHLILGNQTMFLLYSFIGWTILWHIILLFTKVKTVLRIIVLIGTFALALAFAANDLVNFIGAPLGALSAFQAGNAAGANPNEFMMDALANPVRANTWILLLAGVVMVITLWRSKKAQSVTKTEVSLGRQDEGVERFESSGLARGIVRIGISLHELYLRTTPRSLQKWIIRRTDPAKMRLERAVDGEVPAFDLLRAAVNLMVASALVSLGTSLKLPLSTTFVTFMVAMSTSLSDKAWGRDSAVYRVTGVLTVLGGWFFTAFMAFISCFLFTMFIFYVKLPAIIILIVFGGFFFYRSARLHKEREERFKQMELEYGMGVGETDGVGKIFAYSSKFFHTVHETVEECFDGFFSANRNKLKHSKKRSKSILADGDSVINEIFKHIRTSHDEVEAGTNFSYMVASIQLIATTVGSLTSDIFKHIDNNHKEPDEIQVKELTEIKKEVESILKKSSDMLKNKSFADADKTTASLKKVKDAVYQYDRNQLKRMKAGKSKTRNSLLFVSVLSRLNRIAEQCVNITKLAENTTKTK